MHALATCKKNPQKFAHLKENSYLCTQIRKKKGE